MNAFSLSEPVALCAVLAAVVLVAPALEGRFKAVAMAILLAAGAALGPGGLGVLGPGGLSEGAGKAALAYAAFLAGLEAEVALIRRGRGQGLFLGAAGAAIALCAALAAGSFLLGLGPLSSLALGAFIASDSLIGHAAVQRFGIGRSKAAGAASTASAVLNVVAVAALAIVSAASGDRSAAGWAVSGAAALALAGLAAFILPRFSAFFLKRVKPEGHAEFAYAILAPFALAWGAIAAGLGPVAGAFAAGLGLNPLIPEKSVLMKRLRFAGNSLILPFFLVYTGSLVDLRSLADPAPVLAAAGLVLAAALFARGLPALALRAFKGYGAAESALALGITAGQAELSVVIIAAGVASGLIPGSAGAGALMAAIVCSAAGALVSARAAKALAMGSSSAQVKESEGGERVMAIVSNPKHALALVDLASLLSPKDSGDPVYAANVIQDPSDAERGLTESERTLAQIVLRGVAAGINVIPVTKVSYNVSEGVTQAASELRASAIVAGAGPESQFMKRPYGQVIDQAVSSTRQLFLVLRSPTPLNLLSHVVAVVPPLSERQAGFTRAAAAVKAIARGIKARVTLVSLDHAIDSVAAEWSRARPQIPFQRIGAADWKVALAELSRHPEANTLFALFNVRQGSLAWQPAVDKLPLAFLGQKPKASLLCVYVPESEEGEAVPAPEAPAPAPAPEDLLGEADRRGRVIRWGQSLALADAVRALVRAAFPEDRGAQTRLSALFSDIAQKEPVELSPGIVLLHAHVSEVEEPVILWGLSGAGIPTLSLEAKVKVLIVLLAPEGQPPEEHLRVLSRLAGTVMDPSFAERLAALEKEP